MTRERLKELWPVMEAFRDEKPIQYRSDKGWIDYTGTCPNFYHLEWRVKPEPREVWANEYPSGLCWDLFFRNQRDANAGAGTGRIRAVRFVEVME